MKTLMAAQLKEGQKITTFFLIKSATLRKSKNDQDYMVFVLHDRTGSVKGYLWNAPETALPIKPGCFAKVRGHVKKFNGANILHISKIRLALKSEIDVGDFIAARQNVSEKELQKMKEGLWPERGADMVGSKRK